jgi:hypothetical protein
MLDAACKVVDNACTFLLGDRLNPLSDGCIRCSNGARVTLVDDLEEPPEVEIWGDEVLVIVDLLRKLLAHGYPLFHISRGQLVLQLDPVRVKFEVLNQNAPNRRHRDSKLLALASQRCGRNPAD